MVYNLLQNYLTEKQIDFLNNFLEKESLKINPKFFKKGYRGAVLLVERNKNFFILKIKRKDNIKTLNKEYKILKLLEKYNIAPKVFKFDEKYQILLMEFVKGISFKDFKIVLKDKKLKIYKIKFLNYIKKTLEKLYILDNLKIFHSELGGGKHIYFYKGNVKFIDFESAKFTNKPKNIFQFLGANLLSDKIILEILNLKKENILFFLKEYKETFPFLNQEKFLLLLRKYFGESIENI